MLLQVAPRCGPTSSLIPLFSLTAHLTTWREGSGTREREGSRRCDEKSTHLATRRLGLLPLCVTAVPAALGRSSSLCWLWCPSCKMKGLQWQAS